MIFLYTLSFYSQSLCLFQVNVPRENGAGPLGKRGLTAVRGPNRIDRTKAEEDVRLLVEAYKRGGRQKLQGFDLGPSIYISEGH